MHILNQLFILLLLTVVIVELRVVHLPRIKVNTNQKRPRRSNVDIKTWPSKVIPYAFSNIMEFDIEARDEIKEALDEIEKSVSEKEDTCVQFVERQKEKDFILFVNDGNCSTAEHGFIPGKNIISMSSDCFKKGILIREVILRLGFKQKIGPTDYHSILHYNNPDAPKAEKSNMLYFDKLDEYRNTLSTLDKYIVQTLYKCKQISMPDVELSEDNIEQENWDKIIERFRLEAEFNCISKDIVDKYLDKSYEMCGVSHTWPLSYPLLESKHPWYKLLCLNKKPHGSRCRYSIECEDETAVCVRPFYKRRGYCTRFTNQNLNSVSNTVNDWMFKIGNVVKRPICKMNSAEKKEI